MYDNDEVNDEIENDDSENQSFLSSFYNTNKKLIWIALGIIILIILLNVITSGKGKQDKPENKKLEIVLTYQGEKVDKIDITKGYSIKLKADIESLKNEIFTWSSSNEDVATVESGFVKGKNLGSTTITATYKKEDGTELSESCDITVSEGNPNLEITSVDFPEGDLIMGVHSQYNLGLTISPSKGYISNKKFTSSDENIILVDETGKVESLKEGNARITVDVNNGAFTDSIDVYVLNNVYRNNVIVRADSVLFNSSIEKIKVGDSSRLIYDVSPIDANLDTLTWKSSNEECVTVDNNGNIKGLKVGSSIISVYDIAGKEIGVVTVEVIENIIEVNSITLSTSLITMNLLTQQQIIPIINPSDASNKALDYVSSDESIVMVAPQDNGVTATLFALKKGAVSITIKSNNGKMAYLMVNVIDPNENNSGNNSGNNGGGYSGGSSSCYINHPEYSISSTGKNLVPCEAQLTKSNGDPNGLENGVTEQNISFSNIKNNITLKVCSYKIGSSECNTSSGETYTSNSVYSRIRSQGKWILKVEVYSGNSRIRTDYWYTLIDKESGGGSTSAPGKCFCDGVSENNNCEWSSTGAQPSGFRESINYSEAECKGRKKRECCTKESNGKYVTKLVQSRYCEKDSNGNYIINRTTCESKNGGTGTISPTTAPTATANYITCYYVSGNTCKSSTYYSISCGRAGYALYESLKECNSHIPTLTPTPTPTTSGSHGLVISFTNSQSDVRSMFGGVFATAISIKNPKNSLGNDSSSNKVYDRIYVCITRNESGYTQCESKDNIINGKTRGIHMDSYYDITTGSDNFYDPRNVASISKWTYIDRHSQYSAYSIRSNSGDTINYFIAKYDSTTGKLIDYSDTKRYTVPN